MASVRAIQVPGLGEIALGDWVDDHLWATANVSTTQSSDLQVFTSGRGQQKPGTTSTATDYEVYVPEPGRMPTGWEMLVFSIRLETVATVSAADIQNLENTLLHEFWILGKVYSQGPMSFYPAGGGVSGAVSTTANATTTATWVNGVPAQGAAKQFLVPHKIGSGEAFFSKLRFPTAASLSGTRDVRVVLAGLLKRSVQ